MRNKLLISIIIISAIVLIAIFISITPQISPFIQSLSNNSNNDNSENTNPSSDTINSNSTNSNSGIDDSAGGGAGGATNAQSSQSSNLPSGGRGAYLVKNNSISEDGKYFCETDMTCGDNEEAACGWLNPQQITCTEGPCVIRYVNKCLACQDERVVYYTLGDCPFHG